MANILDAVESDLKNYKCFTERYFTKKYILDADGVTNNDLMLMFHSNRIILLSLAPSHFLFMKNEHFNINFKIGNVNRQTNCVKGKSKKGGQLLSPKSTICKIEFDNGDAINIPCGVTSTLLEINDLLVTKPSLLKDFPDSSGFIAIFLSSISSTDSMKNELLSHEDYLKARN